MGKRIVKSADTSLRIYSNKDSVYARAEKVRGVRKGKIVLFRRVLPGESRKKAEREVIRKSKIYVKERSTPKKSLISKLERDFDTRITRRHMTEKFIMVVSREKRARPGQVGGRFKVLYETKSGYSRGMVVTSWSRRTVKPISRLNRSELIGHLDEAERAAVAQVAYSRNVSSDDVYGIDLVDGPFFRYTIKKESGYAKKATGDRVIPRRIYPEERTGYVRRANRTKKRISLKRGKSRIRITKKRFNKKGEFD